MRITHYLPDTDLFRVRSESLPYAVRIDLAYKRARAIGLANALSVDDVLHLSQKFWDMHTDPITPYDGAATTLLTIQYNLVAGTIASFASQRRELLSLVDDLITFRVIGQFCLTELGRGLDIFNMKTTATLLPTGEFDLHTPTPADVKFMPPTTPVLGIPCIGVVFAQLIVDGGYRGNRPFLVKLNDGYQMNKGITAKLLPPRGGSKPINHALTSFDHVKLPSTALLGTLDRPNSPHSEFIASIWRVSVGSLALASIAIPAIQLSTFILGRYSLRRHVNGPGGIPVPIASFRTQQIPLFAAISQAHVMQAFQKKAVMWFMDDNLDPRARRGIAACAKAVMILHSQTAHISLSERCGAQGLFEYNQISNQHSEVRGISIAEGDILGLSMRLVADLLVQKYEMPPTSDPSSILARHEAAVLGEAFCAASSSADPTQAVYRHVLPRAQSLVEAIGFRMAYDAAVEQGVDMHLLDLYVCNAVKTDAAWFVENGLGRAQIASMEDRALEAAVPRLEEFLQGMNVERYVRAPIISDERWAVFDKTLDVYNGNGTWDEQSSLQGRKERVRL